MDSKAPLLLSKHAPMWPRCCRRMSTSVHVEGSTRTYEGPAPAQQLLAFDEAWITYLEQFVAHKTGDAAAVEVRPRSGFFSRPSKFDLQSEMSP